MPQTLDPRLEHAIQSFMDDHPDLQSRDAAIEAVLEKWLGSNGYLPHDQQGTRPEDLDSFNDG